MNLLITGAWKVSEEQIEEIAAIGHSVVFMQNEKDACPVDYDQVEGVVCNGFFLYHDIEKFKNLRFVQLTSAGFDRIDTEYISTHNIDLFNARGVYSIPMAEYTVCGVLQLLKQSRGFLMNQVEHIWEKNRELGELFSKNVCIVGCGNVGTECAKRFSAFGCIVRGVDLYPNDSDHFQYIAALKDLYTEISSADIVILTLPLSKESQRLFNAETFSKFKNNALLVNISRGGVVDTPALIDALKTGWIAGAVLDVFEDEPLADDSPLWDMKNVIITPHNSFVGEGNSHRLWHVISKNLRGIK